jgi:hypothetical protein
MDQTLPRLGLILGKFPVIEVGPTFFVIEMKSGFYIRTSRPPGTDIRVGDLLTIYTEVLRSPN